jgi:hypothetical protein
MSNINANTTLRALARKIARERGIDISLAGQLASRLLHAHPERGPIKITPLDAPTNAPRPIVIDVQRIASELIRTRGLSSEMAGRAASAIAARMRATGPAPKVGPLADPVHEAAAVELAKKLGITLDDARGEVMKAMPSASRAPASPTSAPAGVAASDTLKIDPRRLAKQIMRSKGCSLEVAQQLADKQNHKKDGK